MVVEEVLVNFTKLSLENPLVVSTGIAVVRSIAGWLENSLEDFKITRYELSQLGKTIFRVVPQALGLGAIFGPGGEVGAFLTDWIVVKLSNSLRKKK